MASASRSRWSRRPSSTSASWRRGPGRSRRPTAKPFRSRSRSADSGGGRLRRSPLGAAALGRLTAPGPRILAARRYCSRVNLFDVLILVLVAAAILIGISSGALPQLGGLLGAFAGGVLSIAPLGGV